MSDFSDAIPGIHWYVLYTVTGYENKVKTSLEALVENLKLSDEIVDIRIPVEKVMVGDKETENKLFPSYVLIKMLMNDRNWHIVRYTTGVIGFVGPGSKPVPLTDEEVAEIGIEVKVINLSYNVGDNVKIVAGPLSGFSGVVQAISDDKKKVTLLASMFGRETTVELDSDQVTIDQ